LCLLNFKFSALTIKSWLNIPKITYIPITIFKKRFLEIMMILYKKIINIFGKKN